MLGFNNILNKTAPNQKGRAIRREKSMWAVMVKI
jgi:hypothetical protein